MGYPITRKYESLGSLAGNATLPAAGTFRAGDHMSNLANVLSIVGDVQAAGGGTVTVHFFVDAAGLLGGASEVTMVTATGYVRHIECSPDLYFKLIMTGRTTDDVDFYA